MCKGLCITWWALLFSRVAHAPSEPSCGAEVPTVKGTRLCRHPALARVGEGWTGPCSEVPLGKHLHSLFSRPLESLGSFSWLQTTPLGCLWPYPLWLLRYA